MLCKFRNDGFQWVNLKYFRPWTVNAMSNWLTLCQISHQPFTVTIISISTTPPSASYPAVIMGVLKLVQIPVVAMSMNAVEVIRKDLSSQHKMELDPVVVMLHTVQTNMIVVMDLSRIWELAKLIFSTQKKKDLDLLGGKIMSTKSKFCLHFYINWYFVII